MKDKPNILVIGSSNTDMVVQVPRLPERGETLFGRDFAMVAGGKGANQAVAAARLGAAVTFVTRVGQDLFGQEALQCLRQEGLETRYIVQDPETPSGIALIVVDSTGENSIVVASGANMNLVPADIDAAEPAFAQADILLVQLEIPLETVAHVVALAKRHAVPVILNPAPARTLAAELLSQVAYITPNEVEARQLAGMVEGCTDDLTQVACILRQQGVETVIMTLGGRGALIVSAQGQHRVAAPQVKPVDTTAAGDAFNGALAVALARGEGVDEAIHFANHVAALSVTRHGAQPSMPSLDEVGCFMAGSGV